MPDSQSNALNRDQVAHMAALARLALSEAELDHYTAELQAILGYVEQLQAVDTKAITITGNITGQTNILADDTAGADPIDQNQFLNDAPASQPPHLKVKAVLE